MKKEIKSINISIKHPKYEKVRRQANTIEDLFEEFYLQPTVLPIPDEIDPIFPRISINSKNGHSNINFSQIGVDFNVIYDDKYSFDYSLCEDYIKERMKLIQTYLNQSKIEQYYYVGIMCQVKFNYEGEFDEIHQIQDYYLKQFDVANLYDFNQKITLLEEDTYFHNITLSNYRDYTGDIINQDSPAILSFEKAKISENGIVVTIDINNRYQYTSKGILFETAKLDDSLNYLYSKNREWIDKRIYDYSFLQSKEV